MKGVFRSGGLLAVIGFVPVLPGKVLVGQVIRGLGAEIDEDREKHPDLYSTNSKGNDNSEPKLNSGITNGSTTNEEVNKEVNGENKYTDDTEDLTSSTNTNNK